MVRSADNLFPLDLAIFGGSFDPVHNGHLFMAEYILSNGFARRLAFMPAAVSPFKEGTPPAPAELRVRMLRDGVALLEEQFRERIEILELEMRRPPPSYTVDSLRELRKLNRGQRIGLLLGSDSMMQFERWRNIEEIFVHHPILVFMRTGENREGVERRARELEQRYRESGAMIHILENREIDCASTEIRASLKEANFSRNEVSRCLPGVVLELIRRNGLYVNADPKNRIREDGTR